MTKSIKEIDVEGNIFWYKEGTNIYHRENGPAREFYSGRKDWMINGLYHRKGAPAIVFRGGTKYWYLNDKLHREDGPAIELDSGIDQWYLNGHYCEGVTSQEEFITYKKLQLLK